MTAPFETLPQMPFTTPVPSVQQVVVHPSGALLALVSGTVMWADTFEAAPAGLPGRTHDATALAIAPDGRRLAITTRQRTVVVRDASPAPPTLEVELPAVAGAVRFVDDSRLVVAMAHLGVWVLDATTGERLAEIGDARKADAFAGFAVTRRGERLIVARGQRLRCIELATGRLLWERTFDHLVTAPALSHDGTRVVVIGPVGAEGGTWRRLTPTRPLKIGVPPARPATPSLPPPDAAARPGLRILHTADGSDAGTGPPFPFAGVRAGDQTLVFAPRPQFAPDDQKIAVNLPHGVLAVYDASTLAPDQVVERGPVLAWIEDLAFAPDGRSVVFGTRHNRLGRWALHEEDITSSFEGLDPEAAGSEAPQPWVAAVASFLVPGLGQLFNGQTAKAAVCLGAWIVLLGLCGILNVVYAVDASRIARRLADGEEVRPWQFF